MTTARNRIRRAARIEWLTRADAETARAAATRAPLSDAEIDQRRADMAALTYDADCNCRVCGQHFTAEHAPGCPRGDGFDTMSAADARAVAVERAAHLAGSGAAVRISPMLESFTLATVADDIVTGDGMTHAWCAARVLAGARRFVDGHRAVYSMVTGAVVWVPAELLTDVDAAPAPAPVDAFRFSQHRAPGGYWCRWSAVSVGGADMSRKCPAGCPASRVERDPGALLDADTVTGLGLDATGRDGDPRFPYTYGNLTDAERARLDGGPAAG